MTDVFDGSPERVAGPIGKLTEYERAALPAVAAMPDDEIDLSGEPEVKGLVRRCSWLALQAQNRDIIKGQGPVTSGI